MLMVKAKRNGVYDNAYRNVGDKFAIAGEEKFSMHWMERLSKPEAKEADDEAKAEQQAIADIKATRKKEADDRKEARAADRESINQRRKEVDEIKAREVLKKSEKK